MNVWGTKEFYTRKLLASHPDKRFVFGDNFERVGRGGQAVIRDMPNALGVATKMSPSMNPKAFLTRDNFHYHAAHVLDDLIRVRMTLMSHDIVVSFDQTGRISLGLGLACLDQKCPPTYAMICAYLGALTKAHGGWKTL